jgi:1-deoxy-D-xylulose-5-phosphate reductoisomerase
LHHTNFALQDFVARMTDSRTRVAILGSTGSVGCSALDVVRGTSNCIEVVGLSAFSRLERLEQQANEFNPPMIAAASTELAAKYPWSAELKSKLLLGPDGLIEMVTHPKVDVVLASIVGSAGLPSTIAALEAGKTVALANKETLVVAGPLAIQSKTKSGARLLPVDSEHSAVFQSALAGSRSEIRRIILTASGGPFRNCTWDQMKNATIEQALAHPTWDMGHKISIDSATMMNKALEIIEARWLFGLDADQIEVAIHPQSIVHSMVEFVDGSVLAQMGPPDMKLPIQYALTWPERIPGPSPRLDLSQPFSLDFEPPDCERFPALELGHEVARTGGTSGAVLNGANEAAVAAFLAGEIKFTDIVAACSEVLKHHNFDPRPSLDEVIRLDRWARQEVTKWICS